MNEKEERNIRNNEKKGRRGRILKRLRKGTKERQIKIKIRQRRILKEKRIKDKKEQERMGKKDIRKKWKKTKKNKKEKQGNFFFKKGPSMKKITDTKNDLDFKKERDERKCCFFFRFFFCFFFCFVFVSSFFFWK